MSEPISRLALPLAAGALATLTGCLTLDGFAFNPVHCSQISEATCEGASSIWNEMCTPCEETYPWDKEYDWIEGTLADGGAVRAIDPATASAPGEARRSGPLARGRRAARRHRPARRHPPTLRELRRRWLRRPRAGSLRRLLTDLRDPGVALDGAVPRRRAAGDRVGQSSAGVDARDPPLASTPGVDPGRLAVTGFCMGGGFALLAAADGAWAVAAPFYGVVPRSPQRLQGLCPTIAQFGARDAVYRGAARRLAEYLEALDVPHEVLIHEEAGHSFMNDHPDPLFGLARFTPLRARHHAPTEVAAWDALLAFFASHMPTNGASG